MVSLMIWTKNCLAASVAQGAHYAFVTGSTVTRGQYHERGAKTVAGCRPQPSP